MMERLRERFSRMNPRAALAVGLIALLAFALGAFVFRTDTAPVETPKGQPEQAIRAAESWTCAMHPQIRTPEPGMCPICGMDLVPVTQEGGEETRADRITLSERAKALAKLRTTVVRRQADPASEVRLLGRIEPDETSSKTITAWVAGRIDRLHVRVTGERVRAGQTVATLYSPEVLAAHQDLIAARHQVERMQAASDMARSAADAALEAARNRLRLLGVSDQRVLVMQSQSQPTRELAISSPFSGTVIERLAAEGTYVSVGEPLYKIADLSRVWVQLDAYERDLPALQVKQSVNLRVESLPDESFEGRIAFIDPVIDSERRTARVRIEVPNRGGHLRPGMFVQAVVQGRARTATERPLVIPHTAPLFTGRRAVVYVEVENADRPTYEARLVRLGPRAGDVYPVVAGLSEGEHIVSKGAFVLDADLQIRGGQSMMASPDDTQVGSWDQAIELVPAERNKLRPVLGDYLKVQEALAADDLPSAKRAADSLNQNAARIDVDRPPSAKEAWPLQARELRRHAEQISRAESLEVARGAFEALTRETNTFLARFGNPMESPIQLAFCPMAAGTGATWIQQGKDIENPYFGASMRSCGELRESVPPSAHLSQHGRSEADSTAPKPAPKAEGQQR